MKTFIINLFDPDDFTNFSVEPKLQIPTEFDFEKEFNFGLRQSIVDKYKLKREVIERLVNE